MGQSARARVMPCWAWVAPLLWCFIPSWLLSTKSRNFIKYWDSGLNAQGSRRFIATVHITAVIGRRRWGKKAQGKLSLAPNLLLNWVSYPLQVQCTFFLPVFWNLYMTKQGFRWHLFLTLRITLLNVKIDFWLKHGNFVDVAMNGISMAKPHQAFIENGL